MDLYAVLDQIMVLLQQRGRLTYRALQYQFKLDEEGVEALKAELIDGQQVASDEGGKVLIWKAPSGTAPLQHSQSAVAQAPAAYTPSHLAERIRAEQAALEARGATEGERKSITALFADIKGSTDLIADLDPEEARAILDPTLQLMMEAVHRYEGYVAQALGDGIFALFGAPIAHEDHPQRALYAALLMQEQSRKRAEQLRREKGVNLQIRVGVNTGEVVLRSIRKDDLHTDYVPVGQSIHLASRMESLATSGSILVSEQTYKLTEGYFDFTALGQAQVKGFPEPLNIYEVGGVGTLRTKLQLSVHRGLARFVGRKSEMEQLQQAWEQAKAGHGQITAVMGEPGVGKSRLFYEFIGARHAVPRQVRDCLILETFSVSHGKAYPYLPLIELLKNYFQLTTQDDERRRREKITGRVLTLDRRLEDTLPYLFFLLGIAEPLSPLQQMDAQIRRKRILEATKRLLLRESLNQPLIIIFEDLHWLDAETQAFLQLLSESVATARILLLVNYRPEYQQQWSGKTYFSQLRLDPLGKEQAEEMLAALLNDASASPLPAGEKARGRGVDHDFSALERFILDKTEGNPFFMEEIVQTLREQGLLNRDDGGARHAAPLPSDLRLPTTVQGVLSARMDRLSAEEKVLLQTLAVIGREFAASLLRKVVTQPEADLHRLLARLRAAEFVYERPAFPDVEYIFKHALTQEVAYNSLLIERRKVLHERAAQAIEEVYRHRLDDHYSELAYHYSRSENTQKAIDYLQLAGQQAVQRSAHMEAINHLSTAVELLLTRPETPERAVQELQLRLILGPALMSAQGWAAPAVEQHYLRARALCDQLGDIPQRVPVLYGLWGFHVTRGELLTAQALAEECLQLAGQTHEAGLLPQAHFAVGLILLSRGEFVRARMTLEQGVAYYQPQHRAQVLLSGGLSSRTGSLALTALALSVLGYPEQARTRTHEALHLAQELGHPYSLVQALCVAAWVDSERGDGRVAQERADALIALCSEHGFPLYLAWGTMVRGEALIAQAQWEEGVAQILQGLEVYTGELWRTMYLTWLAVGYRGAGQVEEGLATVAEALWLVDKNDERIYEAELYRLKGDLTLQSRGQSLAARVKEAEVCFLKAIEIACHQQAKSLELRAVMSLSRLWQQQGKKEEARQMLAETYNWFTEGFDTADLKDAKAFLEGVSRTLDER